MQQEQGRGRLMWPMRLNHSKSYVRAKHRQADSVQAGYFDLSGCGLYAESPNKEKWRNDSRNAGAQQRASMFHTWYIPGGVMEGINVRVPMRAGPGKIGHAFMSQSASVSE